MLNAGEFELVVRGAAAALAAEFRPVVRAMRGEGADDRQIRALARGILHDAEVEARAAGRSRLPRAVTLAVVTRALDVTLSERWDGESAG